MALTYTPEQIAEKLDKLSQPFHPKDVQWRVTNKSQDGKKGMVAAYADPRAYSARLNEVFTPAGWSFELVTETTTGLTRMRHGKSVPTGKVSVIATLEIFGISKKASTGEMWADDDNAVTRAEAQAKKRAASMFGLGEYFYELKSLGSDLWVPLDAKGNPTRLPKLPHWALPVEMRQAVGPTKTAAQPATAQRSAQQPQQQGQQQTQQQTGASVQQQRSAPQGEVQNPQQKRNRSAQLRPQQMMSEPEKRFRDGYPKTEAYLGVQLTKNILEMLLDKLDAGELQGDKFEVAISKLDTAVDLLSKIRTAAAEAHLSTLDSILGHYNVKDLDNIPTYQVLYCVAMDLAVVPRLEKKAA
jgi:hypothetical protein